ncbi:hypothetical protein C8R42DRAFT_644198 [Lentinula raphanica]|nr:hypothetical protein C8R42DRAFT_644198 [Lentinula raphanica]
MVFQVTHSDFGQERCIIDRRLSVFLVSTLHPIPYPALLILMKSIYKRFKGKRVQSDQKGRRATAGSRGTGAEDESRQSSRPWTKPSTRSTCWDLSEQVLSTLTTAAQFAPVPYLGNVSALVLSIFKAVEGARENQEALGELSRTACDFMSLVSSTYQELHPSTPASDTTPQDQPSFSSDPTLNTHVEQLVKTLQKIDAWIKGVQSRKLVRRLISYKSDLRAIQNFRGQLVEAKDNFKVTRHQLIQEQLSTMHEDVQILLIRSSVLPGVSESYSLLRANITPGGPNIKRDFVNPDALHAENNSQPSSNQGKSSNMDALGSVMNPNEPIVEDSDTFGPATELLAKNALQPDSIQGHIFTLNALGFTASLILREGTRQTFVTREIRRGILPGPHILEKLF